MPENTLRKVAQNLIFLSLVIWREIRGESVECQIMAAKTIINRASLGGWWGHSILDVITCPFQYSSMTYKADPQLTIWPSDKDKSWESVVNLVADVLVGKYGTTKADSYHDISIKPPLWAKRAEYICQIGRIIFYKTR